MSAIIKVMRNLYRVVIKNVVTIIASSGLIAILLIVVANVVGRIIFNYPLLGTIEIVELLMVISIFFAIPYTAFLKKHIRVDMLTSRLPKSFQGPIERIDNLASAIILALITYQSFTNAIYHVHNMNETTPIMGFPLAPSKFIMAIGCMLLTLVLLIQFFFSNYKEDEKIEGLE